jgi:hypothetical protein
MSQSTVDSRTVRRVGMAACVVAGPALVGLVRATYPPFAASNDASTIAAGGVARAIVATPDRDWDFAPDHSEHPLPRLATAAN